MKVRIKVPEKIIPVIDNLSSNRYDRIVLYGGRGGAKSDSVAKIAIMESFIDNGVILCGREIQKTVKDSLHSSIVAEIENLGLSAFFEVTNTEIRNIKTGASFIFAGFKSNITNIKSIKNLRVVVAEEAENISQDSWATILPTPRYKQVRFYVVFNTRFEKDPTWQEFVVREDDRTLKIKIGYQDNPWFPDSLERQRLRDLRGDPGRYRWIWEGEFLTISDASIFGKKLVVRRFDESKLGDPLIGGDWGFSVDPTAIIEAYSYERTLYIRNCASKVGLELDDTADWILHNIPKAAQYTSRYDNARPETISKIKRTIPLAMACTKGKGSVEDGIAHILSYDEIVIHPDAEACYPELASYSYKKDRYDKLTAIPNDKDNHYADALRYALEPVIRSDVGLLNWI
jgi:phage terminase large subunit